MRNLTLTVLVLITVVGCGRRPQPVHTDHAGVGQFARLTLPPSATDVRWQTDRDDSDWFSIPAPDHSAWGRFDLPAADVPAFLSQLPKGCKPEACPEFSHVTSHAPLEPWWQPDRIREPQMAEWSQPGFSWNLLYGEAEQAGTVTVYFFNHSM